MKKLLAVMSAAVLGLGMLTAPVSAEETYQLGDVNMDGRIDLEDAMLALQEFVYTELLETAGELTEQQIALANVDGETEYSRNYGIEVPVGIRDAQFILCYYCCRELTGVIDPEMTMEEFVVYWRSGKGE